MLFLTGNKHQQQEILFVMAALRNTKVYHVTMGNHSKSVQWHLLTWMIPMQLRPWAPPDLSAGMLVTTTFSLVKKAHSSLGCKDRSLLVFLLSTEPSQQFPAAPCLSPLPTLSCPPHLKSPLNSGLGCFSSLVTLPDKPFTDTARVSTFLVQSLPLVCPPVTSTWADSRQVKDST